AATAIRDSRWGATAAGTIGASGNPRAGRVVRGRALKALAVCAGFAVSCGAVLAVQGPEWAPVAASPGSEVRSAAAAEQAPPPPAPPRQPTGQLRMRKARTIRGKISPKSV